VPDGLLPLPIAVAVIIVIVPASGIVTGASLPRHFGQKSISTPCRPLTVTWMRRVEAAMAQTPAADFDTFRAARPDLLSSKR